MRGERSGGMMQGIEMSWLLDWNNSEYMDKLLDKPLDMAIHSLIRDKVMHMESDHHKSYFLDLQLPRGTLAEIEQIRPVLGIIKLPEIQQL